MPDPNARAAGAQLVALCGPLAGSILPVPPGGLSIGRHAGNDLRLRDLTASRHHCRLEHAGDRLWVRDLESRAGTFVNGLPVAERDLAFGDVLAVGSSQFLLLVPGAESVPRPPEAAPVRFEEGSETAGSTFQVHLQVPLSEAAGQQRRELLAALPAGSRAARDLGALLEAGAILGELQASEPPASKVESHPPASEHIARRVVELVLAAVPADRAALLLLDRSGRGEEALAVAHARERDRRATSPFPVSRTVARKVMQEGIALLAGGAADDRELLAAESLQAARIRSLLAVPLPGRDGPVGLLYLDARGLDARFDGGHLGLVSSLAAIAAAALGAARQQEALRAENRRLADELRRDLIGESPPMREVQRLVARLGPTESTVLIRGESGTGKEVVARALHAGSARAARPFVAINCAALTETLLESELFGHERGAFTGAVARKLGKFEVADGGTLFLDEIGELPPALQAKLLRALEQREIERLGGTRPQRIDVRVLAATNRDLERAIGEGGFRSDLFYRLNVISVHLPALRGRRGDIPLLASHFAARLSRKLGRPFAGFSPGARACLLRHDWPGNVRELANAVERALTLGSDEVIWPEDLPETLREWPAGAPAEAAAGAASYHAAVNEHKRRLILAAVEQGRGRITEAARLLGLQPTYLHRLIRNLGLKELIKA